MQEYTQDQIVEIIIAFLDGRAGKDDLLWLQLWIGQSEEHQAYFSRIRNIYEMSGRPFDPATIRTDKALQNIIRRTGTRRKTFRLGTWLQRAAAVLFIPLLAASLYFYIQNRKIAELPVSYCEMQAATGLRSFIILPDSSRVWLNSGSKVRYPDRFTGADRTVFVEGEAYFEVISNTGHPFVVNTPNIQVRATGTKFHVADFTNSPVKEVSLVSGRVAVGNFDGGKAHHIHDMQAGQHLEYNSTGRTTQLFEGDLYKYYAWKDNKMVFRNDPMTDVVKRMSQLYGVKIELQGEELKTYRYRATFEEESMYDILRLLKLSAPIDFKEIKRKQQADGSFTQPEIVIFPIE